MRITPYEMVSRAFYFVLFCGDVAVYVAVLRKLARLIKNSYEITILNVIRRIFGATDLIRTGDLLITSELLYQLSHSSR